MKTKKVILADLRKKDLIEQMKKIQEEGDEVGVAYNDYKWDIHENNNRLDKSRLHLISELYDLIQATAGAIWILENGVSMNNEHIEKMEEYVDSGRINNKARGGVEMKTKRRAEKEGEYFLVTSYGGIYKTKDYYNEIDDLHFKMKNYFKSEQEAKESKFYKVFHEEEL